MNRACTIVLGEITVIVGQVCDNSTSILQIALEMRNGSVNPVQIV